MFLFLIKVNFIYNCCKFLNSSRFYGDETNSSLYKIKNYTRDLVCAAKFTSDNKWYRAVIIEANVEQNIATVYYIDYGNHEELPFHRLRLLADDFFKYIILAVPCTLSNVSGFIYISYLN